MYKVTCPVCNEIREVSARKSWMIGTEPFTKACKKHAGGKEKSESCRKKLSEAIKALQTEEVLKHKSDFMKAHPELWVKPQSELGHEAWRGQHHTIESKKKISDGVKKAKENKND